MKNIGKHIVKWLYNHNKTKNNTTMSTFIDHVLFVLQTYSNVFRDFSNELCEIHNIRKFGHIL